MKEIDARGLSCPAPVLETRASLEQDHFDEVKVLVDNPASQENVRRFLDSQGFQTNLDKSDNHFIVFGKRDPEQSPGPVPAVTCGEAHKKTLIMCSTDRIGHGDDDLGLKLMINFIRTLKEMGSELWRLILVNNGVKLSVEGSEVLEDLQKLEKSGLQILVCGTCLNHFNLLEKKQTGVTTNMLDIVTAMQLSDKVITIA
ncbi:MAG: sulfurtransferase-like selenium metabolism protein YedF [Thermodesulfobacteriota bacterium]